MQTIFALSRKLLQDRKAAAAAIVAITLPLLIGGTALAVDVASFRLVHGRMQAAVDAGALAAVVQIDKKGPIQGTAVNLVNSNIPATFGAITTAADVTVGTYSKATGFVAGGADPNAVRVMAERSPARNNGVARMFSALWGATEVTVKTQAIAARPANVFYDPPEGVVLDSSASDFNELYAYCYDMAGMGAPKSRRKNMTLIANNLGGPSAIAHSGGVLKADPVTPMPWPDCSGKNESLSFSLKNYRLARADKTQWQKKGGPELWEHFSDTQISNGIETFDSGYDNILERYLCDTSEKCDPSKAGSIVPPLSTKNKIPQNKVTTACVPGKFMYIGMEDRPPGKGWTDWDYNDIAIRMKCPNSGKLADPFPRLVG